MLNYVLRFSCFRRKKSAQLGYLDISIFRTLEKHVNNLENAYVVLLDKKYMVKKGILAWALRNEHETYRLAKQL